MRRKLFCASACIALSVASLIGAPALAVDPTSSPTGSVPSPANPTALPSIPTIDTPAGDSIRAREYWLTDYGFDNLWAESTGEGVTVAVIDTGVDGTHQDLTGNVLDGYDASGVGDNRGWEGLGIEPEHGTLVASLIAGHGHRDDKTEPNPGLPGEPAGIIGIAPRAKILPISLDIGTSNADGKPVDEQIPDAVRQAVDAGADIINLSVGSDQTSWPESWDSAFGYAEEKGVIVVAAAGNRGSGLTQVGAPATIPGVLTVGGVDKGRHDSWSSSSQGISIAVAAPSEDLIGAIPGNRYALWSGTSASAPIVAGLAALVKQKYPDLTAHQVIQRIVASADDAGADGRDAMYGYGIINPGKALDAQTPDDTDSNLLGSVHEWAQVHRKRSATAQPTPSASETPVHSRGEQLTEAAAPTAHRPAEDSGILPFLVLAGFALWVVIITVGSIWRLSRISTRESARRK